MTRRRERRRPVRRRAPARRRRPVRVEAAHREDLVSLREELRQAAAALEPPRLNVDPDDVQRSVARLVLSLVEFIRQLLERQAVRRMEAQTLTPDQVEALGEALMKLEEAVRELAARFDLRPEDLNLDLGPAGRLI